MDQEKIAMHNKYLAIERWSYCRHLKFFCKPRIAPGTNLITLLPECRPNNRSLVLITLTNLSVQIVQVHQIDQSTQRNNEEEEEEKQRRAMSMWPRAAPAPGISNLKKKPSI